MRPSRSPVFQKKKARGDEDGGVEDAGSGGGVAHGFDFRGEDGVGHCDGEAEEDGEGHEAELVEEGEEADGFGGRVVGGVVVVVMVVVVVVDFRGGRGVGVGLEDVGGYGGGQ